MKILTNGGNVGGVIKKLLSKSKQKARFTDAGITNKNYFD
jgi:hypothetical protein